MNHARPRSYTLYFKFIPAKGFRGQAHYTAHSGKDFKRTHSCYLAGVRFFGSEGVFLMEVKYQKARAHDILAQVKDRQVAEINLESFTTARLIGQVFLLRLKSQDLNFMLPGGKWIVYSC